MRERNPLSTEKHEMNPNSRRAADMRAVAQQFLWHDRLPVGHISVIAGSPAKGKSTLLYRVAQEADVPTIFVTSEEADTTVWRPRVEAAGVDLEKVWHHPEIRFSRNPEHLEHLKELVERYDAKLIVVDPIRNHLVGSLSHEHTVRDIFEPYLAYVQDAKVALVLQMHLLREVNPQRHPLAAIPAGVVTVAKAVYLFGDDPTPGADSNIRVLANADKFNFGPVPASLQFEYATRLISVYDEIACRRRMQDHGYWISRGETKVTAKKLLLTLAPETKARKDERAVYELAILLRDGPLAASRIHAYFLSLEPAISWRTIQRVAEEMGIVKNDDPSDKRRKFWELPPDALEAMEGVTDPVTEIDITEVEIPDEVPEDWTNDDDDESEQA
jgi:hypothetical protein